VTKIEASYTDYLKETNKMLGQGGLLLVSVDDQGNPNAMTIGWGTVGIIWGKPIFVVLVRPSRYTHGLIEITGDFTVNVPTPELADEVSYFGTVSGRDQDKFKAKGLTTTPGKKVKSPIVEECVIHYECRVVHKNDVIPDELTEEIRNSAYPQGDFHRIYFGEILAVYADVDAKKRLA
jgi:flavin reductase (DIM6/NTAB) family NADH-FMN oxidoreductase RutF